MKYKYYSVQTTNKYYIHTCIHTYINLKVLLAFLRSSVFNNNLGMYLLASLVNRFIGHIKINLKE